MSATATIVSTDLVELFDTVPDYLEYRSPESVKDLESDYRIALGRLAKGWGDQLLDLAEKPHLPLSHRDAQAIDGLLERISEVFEQLNSFRGAAFDPSNAEGRQRLRVSDAQILHTVESTMSVLGQLDPAGGPGLWLDAHAEEFQRRLRRLSQELSRRNRLLRGQATTRSSKDTKRSRRRPGKADAQRHEKR